MGKVHLQMKKTMRVMIGWDDGSSSRRVKSWVLLLLLCFQGLGHEVVIPYLFLHELVHVDVPQFIE